MTPFLKGLEPVVAGDILDDDGENVYGDPEFDVTDGDWAQLAKRPKIIPNIVWKREANTQ
jgi:hypothetical protein